MFVCCFSFNSIFASLLLEGKFKRQDFLPGIGWHPQDSIYRRLARELNYSADDSTIARLYTAKQRFLLYENKTDVPVHVDNSLLVLT